MSELSSLGNDDDLYSHFVKYHEMKILQTSVESGICSFQWVVEYKESFCDISVFELSKYLPYIRSEIYIPRS